MQTYTHTHTFTLAQTQSRKEVGGWHTVDFPRIAWKSFYSVLQNTASQSIDRRMLTTTKSTTTSTSRTPHEVYISTRIDENDENVKQFLS